MATSIFAKAKEKAPTKAAKGTDKVLVPVNLGTKLRDLTEKRDEVKNIEAEIKMLEGDILPVARAEFMNLVKRLKARPESFLLQSAGTNMLVIVQDKYLKVTETKEQMIIENKLGEVIEEVTEFSFDPVMLAKHEQAISKAISGIKSMTQEEKDLLIVPKVVKQIRKGTIDKIASYKNPDLVFQLIEAVVQLKNSQ